MLKRKSQESLLILISVSQETCTEWSPTIQAQVIGHRSKKVHPKVRISNEPGRPSSSANYFPFLPSSTAEVVSSVWEAAGGGRGADQCALLSRSVQ